MKDKFKFEDISSPKLRESLKTFIVAEAQKIMSEKPTMTGKIPNQVGFSGFSDAGYEDETEQPAQKKVLQRAKVRVFFDRLKKNPTLMGYLNFTSPVEQVQAITEFAELVGVPKSQVVALLTGIKKVASNS